MELMTAVGSFAFKKTIHTLEPCAFAQIAKVWIGELIKYTVLLLSSCSNSCLGCFVFLRCCQLWVKLSHVIYDNINAIQ